jgi:hypothetical protein
MKIIRKILIALFFICFYWAACALGQDAAPITCVAEHVTLFRHLGDSGLQTWKASCVVGKNADGEKIVVDPPQTLPQSRFEALKRIEQFLEKRERKLRKKKVTYRDAQTACMLDLVERRGHHKRRCIKFSRRNRG